MSDWRLPTVLGLLVAIAAVATGIVPLGSPADASAEAALEAPFDRPVEPLTYDSGEREYLAPAESQAAADAGLLPAGTLSVLAIDGTMDHGEYRWDEEGVPEGDLMVRVDPDRQLVSVYRAGHEIGAAVALYGAPHKKTPVGRHPIRAKIADYHSRTYDAPMPYTLWLTDDGVAVHGTRVKDGRASNGCIGVPTAFAKKLFEAAAIGDVVEVLEHDPETA